MSLKQSIIWLLAIVLGSVNNISAQDNYIYYEATKFLKTGQAFKDAATYKRLPERYKKNMRPYLWELSERSAGLSICFTTNSQSIAVKWKTGTDVRFPHVAETLVKGLDLYSRQNGNWYYAGLGKPGTTANHQAVMVKNMDATNKEFMLNLPMYETVDSIFIGVLAGSEIKTVERSKIFVQPKPLVFYGTSIVEGASAIRPGTAYSSIIARRTDIEAINLGFSGNAYLDEPIAEAMAEIDALCYVMDCGPNLTPAMAAERTVPFIRYLKKQRPAVPVLLIEHIDYPHARFDSSVRKRIDSINNIFKSAYTVLKNEGMKGIYYLPAKELIGNDGEATADGIHPSDLGFMRMAGKIEKRLREILKLKE